MPHLTEWNEYFEVDIEASNVTFDTLQQVTRNEVSHYDQIFEQPMQDLDHFMSHKESHVYTLLYALLFHVHRIDGSERAYLKL